MKQSLGSVSLVVRDYDEALAFFKGKLGFLLVEDSLVPAQAKRWVIITPHEPLGFVAQRIMRLYHPMNRHLVSLDTHAPGSVSNDVNLVTIAESLNSGHPQPYF